MKQKLDPNTILAEEYKYIAQTAFQANEDRVKVFSYFLGSATTLIAATIFPDFGDPLHVYIFIFLFLGLYFLGLFSFLKLIKLRIAWLHSIQAMNRIKNYYLDAKVSANLKNAFLWKASSIPAAGKRWTIAFLMSFVIAFIASFALSVAVLLIIFTISGSFIFIWPVCILLISLIVFLVIWHVVTRDL